MGLQLRLLRKRVLVLVPAADTDQKHLSGRGAGAESAAVVPHGVVAAVAAAAAGAGGAAADAVAAAAEGPAAALVAEDNRPVMVTARKGVYWDLTHAAGTCLQSRHLGLHWLCLSPMLFGSPTPFGCKDLPGVLAPLG